jgi:hypothetical protein
MPPAKILLGLGLIVGIAFVGTYVGDSGGPNRETPHSVDWEFETQDGEVLLTHNGGMPVPRGALFLTIDGPNSDDEEISDLGTNEHRWVGSPFSDEPITNGDTLVLVEPERRYTVIYLHLSGSDGTSNLAAYNSSSSDR